MSLVLVNPPCGNLSGPYLGIPSIVAWLKSKGFRDVSQRDLNIEFFDWAASPAGIDWAEAEIRKRHPDLDAVHAVSGEDQRGARNAAHAALVRAPYLRAHIDEAKQYLRDFARYEHFDEFHWAQQTLEQAYVTVSAPFHPHVLRHGNYDTGSVERKATTLLALCRDRASNLFLRYFEEHSIDGIVAARPRVVGISVSFDSQNLAAFTLAWLIKQRLPEVRIVIGGSFTTDMMHRIEKLPKLFEFVDGFVAFEGELPCEKLAELAQDGRWAPEEVPGFHYKEGGEIRSTKLAPQMRVPDLPPPDFDDLPLATYFSPEPVLPVESSRGCYWTCAFCAHSFSYGGGFRTKSTPAIFEDLQRLRQRYATKSFYLVDECVSPKMMKHLCTAIIESGAEYRLHCEVRFERGLSDDLIALAGKAGFKLFSYGLESANQRVLNHMGKGTKREEIVRILKAAHRNGIHNHAMYFLGFPTETREEAMDTVQFIEENKEYLDLVGLGSFGLEPTAPVAKDPAKYGVTSITSPDEDCILPFYGYEVTSGLGQKEAFELAKEVNTSNETHRELGRFIPRERLHQMFMALRSEIQAAWEQRADGELQRYSEMAIDSPSFLNCRPKLRPDVYLVGTDLHVEMFRPTAIKTVYPMPESGDAELEPSRKAEEHHKRHVRVVAYDGEGPVVYALEPIAAHVLRDLCDETRTVAEIAQAVAEEFASVKRDASAEMRRKVEEVALRALVRYARLAVITLDSFTTSAIRRRVRLNDHKEAFWAATERWQGADLGTADEAAAEAPEVIAQTA